MKIHTHVGVMSLRKAHQTKEIKGPKVSNESIISSVNIYLLSW